MKKGGSGLIALLMIGFLAGYFLNQSPAPMADLSIESELKNFQEFKITEINKKLKVPTNIRLSRNKISNRSNAIGSYQFIHNGLPKLQSIDIFSKKGVDEYAKSCETEIKECFYPHTPTPKAFSLQKKSFDKGQNYSNYKLKAFNGRQYFTSNHNCVSQLCVIREYTTYINDKKVDFWINMTSKEQINEADELFSKINL